VTQTVYRGPRHASCPAWLEDALWSAARACLPANALARNNVLDAIVDRTRRYTSERERLDERLRGPAADADLAARALFYSVADAPKIIVALRELARRGALPGREPLRVTDLGAGAGAMSLGLLAFAEEIGGRDVDLHAVERDGPTLEVAGRALAVAGDRGAGAKVRCERGDVMDWTDRDRDLVIAGTVLNELPDQASREDLARRALAALSDDGAAIFIEPALRATSRDLHRVRDAVIDAGGFVFAPCTRGAAPCPMLEDPDEWCCEERPTDLPQKVAQLAATTGLRDDGLKFSYLVFRRAPAAQADPAAGARALRAVSSLHKQKGKVELAACGDDGLVKVRLLKRNRGPSNRALSRVRRGDVLLVTGSDDLGKADSVELVRNAVSEE